MNSKAVSRLIFVMVYGAVVHVESIYALERTAIVRKLSEAIEFQVPTDNQKVETMLARISSLKPEDWRVEKPFSRNLDIEKSLSSLLPPDTAVQKSMWEGRRVRLTWRVTEVSTMTMDIAVYPSSEDAQLRLVADVWRQPSVGEIANSSQTFQGAVVIRSENHLLHVAYRNAYLFVQYDLQDRRGKYTVDDLKYVENFLNKLLREVAKVPEEETPIEVPRILPAKDEIFVTGGEEEIMFSIPKELVEYKVLIKCLSEDLCKNGKMQKMPTGEFVWRGKPERSGEMLFAIQGIGPKGQIVKQRAVIVVKESAGKVRKQQ